MCVHHSIPQPATAAACEKEKELATMLNIVTNSVTELKIFFFLFLFAEFAQPYYENIADKLLLGTCFSVCGQFYIIFNFIFWVNIHLCNKDRQENSFPFFLPPLSSASVYSVSDDSSIYCISIYDRKKKKVCDGLLSKI